MRCECCGADSAADDAKIQRLKAIVERQKVALDRWGDAGLRELITELCDALEKANPTDRYRKLLQRAREETK